jgi:hypothetical protein
LWQDKVQTVARMEDANEAVFLFYYIIYFILLGHGADSGAHGRGQCRGSSPFLMINSHIIVFSIMKSQLQVVAGLRQDLERGRQDLDRGRLELERCRQELEKTQLEQAAWRDEFRSQMEEKLQHLEEHVLKSLICLPYMSALYFCLICLPDGREATAP